MNCDQCKAEVITDSVYCPQCGARLEMPPTDDPPAGDANPGDGPSEAAAAQQFQERLTPSSPSRDDPEEELWEGGFSPKAMLGTWLGCAAITLAGLVGVLSGLGGGAGWTIYLLVIGVLWIGGYAYLKYRQWSVRYRLTSQRFFHESGILRRVTDRIEVIDMDDIAFEQGLIERFVGVGTIQITSSDRTHPVLKLPGIDPVRDVCEKIDTARRAERIRRSVHIEAV